MAHVKHTVGRQKESKYQYKKIVITNIYQKYVFSLPNYILSQSQVYTKSKNQN